MSSPIGGNFNNAGAMQVSLTTQERGRATETVIQLDLMKKVDATGVETLDTKGANTDKKLVKVDIGGQIYHVKRDQLPRSLKDESIIYVNLPSASQVQAQEKVPMPRVHIKSDEEARFEANVRGLEENCENSGAALDKREKLLDGACKGILEEISIAPAEKRNFMIRSLLNSDNKHVVAHIKKRMGEPLSAGAHGPTATNTIKDIIVKLNIDHLCGEKYTNDDDLKLLNDQIDYSCQPWDREEYMNAHPRYDYKDNDQMASEKWKLGHKKDKTAEEQKKQGQLEEQERKNKELYDRVGGREYAKIMAERNAAAAEREERGKMDQQRLDAGINW